MTLLLAATACATSSAATGTSRSVNAAATRREPDYQPLTKASFDRAASERRIIVLSVQAAWCHWCHVMNAQTLQDAAVLALLDQRFLVVRVDADARPDIATRYSAWGWPATALLTPDGQSIINLRGYQTKDSFLRLLQGLVARQESGQTLAATEQIRTRASEHHTQPPELLALRDRARRQIARSYDRLQHGYGGPKKYPHVTPVEAAWSHVQADALRTYAEVARARKDSVSLGHAREFARYVLGPIRAPSGALYANQDADLGHAGQPGHLTGAQYYALDAAQRRALGAPWIDTNVYANYNGMAIAALCALYEGTDEAETLAAARLAFEVMERGHRRGALYGHAASARDTPLHLSDQVEMGYALLALYTATGEIAFRTRLAELLGSTSVALFDAARYTFASHTPHADAVGVLAIPLISLEDNARMARLMLRAGAVTNDDAMRMQAKAVLSALATDADSLLIASPTNDAPGLVALRQGAGDYTLALETALAPYAVLTVVGPSDDARTQALLASARAYYHPTRLIRHDAPGEGEYPYPGEPVVYLCNDSACSMPVREPAKLAAAADAFMAQQR